MAKLLNLFRRKQSQDATPATAAVNETKPAPVNNKADTRRFRSRSSKGKLAEDAAPPSHAAISQLAPLLDVQLPSEKTPSPTLVTFAQDNSPWVDLGDDPNHRHAHRNSLGLQAILSSNRQHKPVEKRLKAFLDKTRLDADQAALLIEACARVVKEQGSESRGLFRPWRLAESPYLISQALGKFLDLVLPDGAPGILDAFHPFSGIETEGLEKEAILKLIFDEIGPHNAAACLKWGVRHTLFEESRSLEGATNLLAIYDTFAASDIEHDLPQDAYIFLLSPALSARQLRVLALLFEMCSNVAMHAEVTGTSGSHLCHLLGFWLLVPPKKLYKDTSELQALHAKCAHAFEHLFLAYLRAQTGLPRRMVDLCDVYPPLQTSSSATGTTTMGTLSVAISTAKGVSFDKRIDRASTRQSPTKQLHLALSSTLASEDASETAVSCWTAIVAHGNGIDGQHDLTAVLADEATRILSYLKNPSEPLSPRSQSMWQSLHAGRRRSMSADPTALTSNQSFALPSITTSASETDLNRIISDHVVSFDEPQTWSAFATKGFAGTADSDNFSLVNEFGHFGDRQNGTDFSNTASRPTAKLKKLSPKASMPRMRQSARSTDDVLDEREEDDADKQHIVTRLTTLVTDPAFYEVYLDSLDEPVLTSSWPNFVLVELKPFLPDIRTLLVEEEVPLAVMHGSGSLSKGDKSVVTPTGTISEIQDGSDTLASRRKRPLLKLRGKKRVSDVFGRFSSSSKVNIAEQRNSEGSSRAMPQAGVSTVTENNEAGRPAQADQTTADRRTAVARAGSIPTIIKTSPRSPPRYAHATALVSQEEASAQADASNPATASVLPFSAEPDSIDSVPYSPRAAVREIQLPACAVEHAAPDTEGDSAVEDAPRKPISPGDNGFMQTAAVPVDDGHEAAVAGSEDLQPKMELDSDTVSGTLEARDLAVAPVDVLAEAGPSVDADLAAPSALFPPMPSAEQAEATDEVTRAESLQEWPATVERGIPGAASSDQDDVATAAPSDNIAVSSSALDARPAADEQEMEGSQAIAPMHDEDVTRRRMVQGDPQTSVPECHGDTKTDEHDLESQLGNQGLAHGIADEAAAEPVDSTRNDLFLWTGSGENTTALPSPAASQQNELGTATPSAATNNRPSMESVRYRPIAIRQHSNASGKSAKSRTSESEGSPSTDANCEQKQTWSQLNRVSPSLKARISETLGVSPVSSASVSSTMASSVRSVSAPESKRESEIPPVSPSKRAARLLSNARRILSRKRSNVNPSTAPEQRRPSDGAIVPPLPVASANTENGEAEDPPTQDRHTRASSDGPRAYHASAADIIQEPRETDSTAASVSSIFREEFDLPSESEAPSQPSPIAEEAQEDGRSASGTSVERIAAEGEPASPALDVQESNLQEAVSTPIAIDALQNQDSHAGDTSRSGYGPDESVESEQVPADQAVLRSAAPSPAHQMLASTPELPFDANKAEHDPQPVSDLRTRSHDEDSLATSEASSPEGQMPLQAGEDTIPTVDIAEGKGSSLDTAFDSDAHIEDSVVVAETPSTEAVAIAEPVIAETLDMAATTPTSDAVGVSPATALQPTDNTAVEVAEARCTDSASTDVQSVSDIPPNTHASLAAADDSLIFQPSTATDAHRDVQPSQLERSELNHVHAALTPAADPSGVEFDVGAHPSVVAEEVADVSQPVGLQISPAHSDTDNDTSRDVRSADLRTENRSILVDHEPQLTADLHHSTRFTRASTTDNATETQLEPSLLSITHEADVSRRPENDEDDGFGRVDADDRSAAFKDDSHRGLAGTTAADAVAESNAKEPGQAFAQSHGHPAQPTQMLSTSEDVQQEAEDMSKFEGQDKPRSMDTSTPERPMEDPLNLVAPNPTPVQATADFTSNETAAHGKQKAEEAATGLLQ